MLRQLHLSHLGIVKTKERARTVMFWPNITGNIEKMINACDTCCKFRNRQQKDHLLNMEIPSYPFQHVGADLFTFRVQEYLITTDYYSRWLEMDKLTSSTSFQVISKLKAHFACHGVPEKMTTDNGLQFSSQAFKTFMSSWNIENVTSSPRYPQANGLSEKAVQTAKRIMAKALDSRTDPYMMLLELRNTRVDRAYSPAQLLMSRQLRSVLPVLPQALHPKLVDSSTFMESRRKAQLKQKTAYDRGSRTATELDPNQKAWVKLSEDSKWEKATIEKKYDKAPRSYNLFFESGGTFRRNRRDIRPRYEFASPTTYDGQQIGAADTIPPMGQSLQASTPDKQTSTKFVAEGDRSSAPLQVQAHTRPTPTTRVVLPNPLPTLTGDSSLYSQPGSSPVTITNQQVEQDTTTTGGGTQPLASTSQTRTTILVAS